MSYCASPSTTPAFITFGIPWARNIFVTLRITPRGPAPFVVDSSRVTRCPAVATRAATAIGAIVEISIPCFRLDLGINWATCKSCKCANYFRSGSKRYISTSPSLDSLAVNCKQVYGEIANKSYRGFLRTSHHRPQLQSEWAQAMFCTPSSVSF